MSADVVIFSDRSAYGADELVDIERDTTVRKRVRWTIAELRLEVTLDFGGDYKARLW